MDSFKTTARANSAYPRISTCNANKWSRAYEFNTRLSPTPSSLSVTRASGLTGFIFLSFTNLETTNSDWFGPDKLEQYPPVIQEAVRSRQTISGECACTKVISSIIQVLEKFSIMNQYHKPLASTHTTEAAAQPLSHLFVQSDTLHHVVLEVLSSHHLLDLTRKLRRRLQHVARQWNRDWMGQTVQPIVIVHLFYNNIKMSNFSKY